jgi:DNA-binding transcriptional LysR family regulator
MRKVTPEAAALIGVGRRLRFRDLHMFFTVVECGSMAKAAIELGLSQPAVSGVIADLEHTFGVPLFDRSNAGVEPTVYGQALLRRGLAAFDELKLGLRDIKFLANPARGEVRIGCPDSIAGAILAPLAWNLCRDYPGITLMIEPFPKPASDVPQLRARELDVVLLRWTKHHADDPFAGDFNVEILFDDEVVIAASADSRWARRRELALADLQDALWLGVSPLTLTSKLMEQAFRADGLPVPTMRVVTFSVQLRAHLLATGDYVSPMPRSMLRLNPECKGLTTLPIRLPHANFPVAVLSLKARTLPAAAALFLDRLRAHVASLGLTTSAPLTPPARPRSGRVCAAPAARPDRNRRPAP